MAVPVEFLLFAATLVGVALFHRHTLAVALTGLACITAWKLSGGFDLLHHLAAEWVILANLFALLVGFALLARHFEDSRAPQALPRILPDDWKGGFVLLALVFVLSAFLDNIAAAIIGATIASTVFRRRVHIGFLAAIVAAANAGGAGSVVGDTTTTMMWLDGVSPLDVMHAWVASVAAFLVFAIPASRAQQRLSPIAKQAAAGVRIDVPRVVVVVLILVGAIVANVYANSLPDGRGEALPYVGGAVIGIMLLLAPWRRPDWRVVPGAAQGALFLIALVLCASMMPVNELPAASVASTFGLGAVSAVFDNIPLTRLALAQGGYDWGVLAYAVGFGGSMTWFGSSAGVAVANLFPEARSVYHWVRNGWYVAVGYTVGFLVVIALLGWNPHAAHR